MAVQNVDQIKPDNESIGTFLDKLINKQYQIPTFQRDLVWDKNTVKKLWDSIFRFYPIGSILVWNTDRKLKKHRAIGGHILETEQERDFNYILDGQQRTTALLTSIYGVESDEWEADYQPPLYVDLTVDEAEDVEDSNYQERFLFWDEIDDRDGQVTQNVPRMEKYQDGYIVSLNSIKNEPDALQKQLHDKGHTEFDDPIRQRLRNIGNVLRSYQISKIILRNIEVDEVTEIFERVNQQGESLGIFDVVVAKTFRPVGHQKGGFYLREMVENFRETTDGQFTKINDLTYLRMMAMIIKYHVDDNSVHNITKTYLPNIRTEQIETVWDGCTEAFRKTFDFFENHLNLKGPELIPYRYFYITISFYFYDNPNPDYDLLRRYFWYYSFHEDEKLRNTEQLRNDHLDKLYRAKNGEQVSLEPFLLDKDDLRSASYSYQGRFSRAILSFLSYQEPKDWKYTTKSVINEVYYQLTDEPELHHIFPVKFLEEYPGDDKYDSDTMMNIAFLPKITNLEIGSDNPLEYIQEYDQESFESVLDGHIIPEEILDWKEEDELGHRYLDNFVDTRVEMFEEKLRSELSKRDPDSSLGDITINVTDTRQYDGENIHLLIDEGEGQRTEFKSTFRQPVDNDDTPERVIEFECLKTINAFLNHPEGGRLLIGVSDEGGIHGLEDDYVTFSDEQNRDVFEQTLLNKVASSIGPRFNEKLSISFFVVDGGDICLVEVDTAHRPAFIEFEGKEKFHVRRGNRTVSIEGREQAEYIDEYFDEV